MGFFGGIFSYIIIFQFQNKHLHDVIFKKNYSISFEVIFISFIHNIQQLTI